MQTTPPVVLVTLSVKQPVKTGVRAGRTPTRR